jgi:hypothetical protein
MRDLESDFLPPLPELRGEGVGQFETLFEMIIFFLLDLPQLCLYLTPRLINHPVN